MAKQRHDTPPSSSKMTMVILIVASLIVASLVIWALTRTVEPTVPVAQAPVNDLPPTATTATAPAPSTTSPTSTAPITMPPPTNAATGDAPLAPPPQTESQQVARIAAEDLRAKMQRGEVLVIDVRDANSYRTAHIPGAIHIPFSSVEAAVNTLPRNQQIVTYCT